jgi:hypothetical protein
MRPNGGSAWPKGGSSCARRRSACSRLEAPRCNSLSASMRSIASRPWFPPHVVTSGPGTRSCTSGRSCTEAKRGSAGSGKVTPPGVGILHVEPQLRKGLARACGLGVGVVGPLDAVLQQADRLGRVIAIQQRRVRSGAGPRRVQHWASASLHTAEPAAGWPRFRNGGRIRASRRRPRSTAGYHHATNCDSYHTFSDVLRSGKAVRPGGSRPAR